MKLSPDTQNKRLFPWHFDNLMASFFYYGRLSLVKLDRWQARSNGLHVDQRKVKKTISRTSIKMDINLSLQIHGCYVKRTGVR